jgi:hypothetical protein
MSIISAALIGKLADFGVKVLVRLAIRIHKGPAHELAEKYREELRKAGK